MFIRNCPGCNTPLEYKLKGVYKNALKRNSLCRTCSQLGKHEGKNTGSKNGNWKNKAVNRETFLKAVKLRGQGWDEETKKAHSEKMLGDSNWMRGKKHSKKTKKHLSKVQKEKWENGEYKINTKFVSIKISKAEKEIERYLTSLDINFIPQHVFDNSNYIYDFYLPNYNLIIEYNGDFWHANPKKFKAEDILKFPRKQIKTAAEIWDRDLLKKEKAEELGIKVKYIWEKDYKDKKFKLIDNILCKRK